MRNAFLFVLAMLMSACANDMIVSYGDKGDAVVLVGQGDSFDCADPAFAEVKKVVTTTMHFSSGESMSLCRSEEAVMASKNGRGPMPHTSASASVVIPGTGSGHSKEGRQAIDDSQILGRPVGK